ncbi:hypothetical protein ANN_27843, partial [Periplaneta americana]
TPRALYQLQYKMATFSGAECVLCVFWFHETESLTTVQRKFRTQYRKHPPRRSKIYSWHRTFVENSCSVRHGKSPVRPRISDAVAEQVRENFIRSPRKSTRDASREIGITHVVLSKAEYRKHHFANFTGEAVTILIQHVVDAQCWAFYSKHHNSFSAKVALTKLCLAWNMTVWRILRKRSNK